jgi:hypothetical protein
VAFTESRVEALQDFLNRVGLIVVVDINVS